MLYSFIFFHTIIQVNDPEASLPNMSNTINKKPCKNTTQASTNHTILLNSFFLYKNPNIYYFFLPKIHCHCHFIFQLIHYKIWQEYSYTSIVQYSYIFLYEYCEQYSFSSIVVAKFKWSPLCTRPTSLVEFYSDSSLKQQSAGHSTHQPDSEPTSLLLILCA